jgi:hypothetical protein
VQHVSQELKAVDKSRARPREVRSGIHRDDAARPDAAQPVGEGVRLLQRARRVVSARHADDDLGLRGRHRLPGRLLGMLAGEAEHVDAPGQLDQLRRPVAGGEHRIQPLDRGDRRARGALDGRADAVDARPLARDEVQRGVARPGCGGDGADVAHRLADRLRVERDHLGARDYLLSFLDHFVVRHGTDRAQLLGDDQVGLELA